MRIQKKQTLYADTVAARMKKLEAKNEELRVKIASLEAAGADMKSDMESLKKSKVQTP